MGLLSKSARSMTVFVGVLFVSAGLLWAAPTVQIGAGMTAQQKSDRVAAILVQVKETHAFAMDKLKQAKSDNDLVQVNCVNDKLARIKGFLKISERAKKSLQNAIRGRDDGLVQHEFARMSLIADRVENLRLQVEGCIGELSQYTGDSKVTVAVDPDIRQDDPSVESVAPTFEALNVVRPPAVTGSE